MADGEGPRLTAAQLHVVVTLGFCGLVSAADNWFVSPALPAIAHTLSVAPTAAAIVLTAYLLPYGALQPVCGRLGDGVGRLRLLRIIVLGLCVGTFLCAVVPSLEFLVVARVVTGCFAAGIISVSQAFVGDVVGPGRRAGAVGILMGITFTGQGLSAGLGGILTDLVGWRAAFAAFGVLAALAWLGLFTLREPKHQGSLDCRDGRDSRDGRGGTGESRATAQDVDATSIAAPAAQMPSADAVSAAAHDSVEPITATNKAVNPNKTVNPNKAVNPIVAFFRDALRIFFGPHRAVFLLACSTGLLFLGVYGLMGTFLSEACGLTSTQAGLVMMLYGVFCLIGGALSGRLGAGRGLAHVVGIGEVSGLVSAIALVLSAVSGSWVPALVAAAALGLGYILVQPTLVTLSMEADPNQAGLCTGLIGFAVFACGGVGSALGGALLQMGGYPLLWGVAALCLVLQRIISQRVLA